MLYDEAQRRSSGNSVAGAPPQRRSSGNSVADTPPRSSEVVRSSDAPSALSAPDHLDEETPVLPTTAPPPSYGDAPSAPAERKKVEDPADYSPKSFF